MGSPKNEVIRKKGRGGGSHSAMTSTYKGRFKSNTTTTTRKDTDYRGENMVDVLGGGLEPQLLHYNGALRGMKAMGQRKPEPFS